MTVYVVFRTGAQPGTVSSAAIFTELAPARKLLDAIKTGTLATFEARVLEERRVA